MRWPLVTRRRFDRRIGELTANVRSLKGQRDRALADLGVERAAKRTVARQYIDGDAENARLRERLVEAERMLRDQGHLVRAQQDRLDELLGLDDPAVAAGSARQERRPDKPREAKP